MTTETLTGRELDKAVARVLGYDNVRDSAFQPPRLVGRSADGLNVRLLAYSAADCSGLAPVLAWLAASIPGWMEPRVKFELIEGTWLACIDYYPGSGGSDPSPAEYQFVVEGDTLPEAACRLLVAWAAKRGTP